MAGVQIGRIGLGGVVIDNVGDMSHSAGRRDRPRYRLRGVLRGATLLADAKYLRDELLAFGDYLAQDTYSVIPVISTSDPEIDGYYRLLDVDLESRHLFGPGGIPYTVALERVGGTGTAELQSLLTGTVLQNDHGVIDTETEAFHALPAEHVIYEGNANLGSITRPLSAGTNVRVYRQVQVAALPDPKWLLAPADFYKGACKVTVDSRLRSGLEAPNDPYDWTISNDHFEVRASATQGRIETRIFDSAWSTWKLWRFELGAGPTVISAFHSMNILRNDPEEVRIRVVNDQAPSGSAHRNYIELRLRRGSAFVEVHWDFTEAVTTTAMKIRLETGAAGTAVTPTGATSAVAVRATSNDGEGHRYVVGTKHSHTADTTNGGVSRSNAENRVHAFLGMERDGSTAQDGDQADDLCLQYLGAIGEKVRAVRR